MLHIAQGIVNSIERSLSSFDRMSRWDWIVLKSKFLLRRLLLAVRDWPVEHRIGEIALRLPLSHKLPIDDAAAPGRSDNLARIAHVVGAHKESLLFIDIGANIGDTVAVLRKDSRFPILAIEGDEEYYAYLQRNMSAVPDVWTYQGLLSDCPQTAPGELLPNYGGSKQVAIRAGSPGTLRFLTLVEVLDRFPQFKNAGMIKIDTDGFDCRIIRGAAPWLEAARPVLFFEYDPYHLIEQGDDGLSIFGTLRGIGYSGLLVFEGNGDFMYSLELHQQGLLEEMHYYLLGGRPRKYADLCAFHSSDSDVFERCRSGERRFARMAGSRLHPHPPG